MKICIHKNLSSQCQLLSRGLACIHWLHPHFTVSKINLRTSTDLRTLTATFFFLQLSQKKETSIAGLKVLPGFVRYMKVA